MTDRVMLDTVVPPQMRDEIRAGLEELEVELSDEQPLVESRGVPEAIFLVFRVLGDHLGATAADGVISVATSAIRASWKRFRKDDRRRVTVQIYGPKGQVLKEVEVVED